MSRTALKIFNKTSAFLRALFVAIPVVLTGSLILSGCTLFDPPPTAQKPKPPERKVFYAPYDQVWRAAQLAMGRYPLPINDMEKGMVETEYIRGPEGFRGPLQTKPYSSGVKYKLILRLVKGSGTGRKEAVRVSVIKKMEINRDFFSEAESLISDGLEEKVILYRMERELAVETTLRKASETPDAIE